MSFEIAFEIICELIKDFKENENHFLCADYNESQTRKDFIDKFFIALGWDVNHTTQRNPYKQEVKVERTQVNQRRPEYTFSLEPNFKEPKFFVEAKKNARIAYVIPRLPLTNVVVSFMKLTPTG